MGRGWTRAAAAAWALTMAGQASAQSVIADAPYYGPMKRWHGIGYEQGYKHALADDGSWRITGATLGRGHAVDIALYRAAELARDQGYAYVQLLGGGGMRIASRETVTLYARPSRSPAPPEACRSGRRGSCYTADVAELLRVLGGPDGMAPGMPVVDHRDEHGRAVSYSGFGIAAASPTRTLSARPALMPVPVAVSVPRAIPGPLPAAIGRPTKTYEQLLKAQQGVRGGDPQQGWTISD